jgi:hypothetical protein
MIKSNDMILILDKQFIKIWIINRWLLLDDIIIIDEMIR